MSDNVYTPIDMAIQHGIKTSDRLSEELLLSISELINGKEIHHNGKTLTIKPLGGTGVANQNGEWRLLFDVKGVEGFNHIEFKVTKTGWEK